MSLLRRDSASLEKQRRELRNHIRMIDSKLHGITELINVRKLHVNNESLTNNVREGIQTKINKLEKQKAELETKKTKLKDMLKHYT